MKDDKKYHKLAMRIAELEFWKQQLVADFYSFQCRFFGDGKEISEKELRQRLTDWEPMRAARPETVGEYFEIRYGQKSLHSKEGLLPGQSLVISSSGMDNGCYGFFDFEDILTPPFVSVPSTGSIAIAHVQEWPCGITDDCLLLSPKAGVPHAMLYVAAAAIRSERWRFSYGRKATPARIAEFPLPHTDELLARIEGYLMRAARVEDQILEDAEDALDDHIARQRIEELETGTVSLVSGNELAARLSALLEN